MIVLFRTSSHMHVLTLFSHRQCNCTRAIELCQLGVTWNKVSVLQHTSRFRIPARDDKVSLRRLVCPYVRSIL